MNSEFENAIIATDKKAQYDKCAKRLLGEKYILAYILTKTVDEFKGMSPSDAMSYIEGEPYISAVSVDPGFTNGAKKDCNSRIVGFNSENEEINEGTVRFDIVFYVRLPEPKVNGFELMQVIVNLEVQKEEPSGYDILNRAIFYVSRLISSQKERDFKYSNYNDLKRVYSIWICLNMPTNSMCHIHLIKEDIVETHKWKGNLSLLNIIMIGLSNEIPTQDEKYELHRMLGTLLSNKISAADKLTVLKTEYDVPINEHIEEDLNIMCNLSEAIEERGIEKGIEKGIERGIERGEIGIILNMDKKGFTLEQIAYATDKSPEEVQNILEREKGLNE